MQTTLSNAFSWMKILEFRLKFHWRLSLRVQLTISQHWFRWWLGADEATSHYLNQWWFDYRRIYASLGLNAFNGLQMRKRGIRCNCHHDLGAYWCKSNVVTIKLVSKNSNYNHAANITDMIRNCVKCIVSQSLMAFSAHPNPPTHIENNITVEYQSTYCKIKLENNVQGH